MAKNNIGEFVRQVRSETRKIVWPTSREVMMTTIMVFIMSIIFSLFFLGVDTIFGTIINWLTNLAL